MLERSQHSFNVYMDKAKGSDIKGYKRRFTREVMAGKLGIGGHNPVRVQSMTSTPTLDTQATVNQILRLCAAGAELVRMTVQNVREAENLANIKTGLLNQKCVIPLVADVHFNPAIAEVAASVVEKVRINPGNYGASPRKAPVDLSDEAYYQELAKAKTSFARLISICRTHGTALRIGVNHGSLSPRIINRFGNTPEGMALSAMEFLRFCRDEDFHNVVVSLKSSNTLVMVMANRLMVKYMENEDMTYPLHLGVTEAGEGEDGRIRSIAGIGTLLWEGTGDTVRVSLTEDPEREVPVARKMLACIKKCQAGTELNEPADLNMLTGSLAGNQPGDASGGRISFPAGNIGGDRVPVVIADITGDSPAGSFSEGDLSGSKTDRSEKNFHHVTKLISGDSPADYYFEEGSGLYASDKTGPGPFPIVSAAKYLQDPYSESPLLFLQVSFGELTDKLLAKAGGDKNLVFIALSQSVCPVPEMKLFIKKLDEKGCNNPVIFKKEYFINDRDDFQIEAATDFAPLFLDRLGDGLWIVNRGPGVGVSHENAGSHQDNESLESIAPDTIALTDSYRIPVSTAFSILQSARVRTTKTEFISCPSCGRTRFNIQKATAAVKQRTSHLKGLKIAVMGCIVNGPGEMADADYGYVGSGKGRVSLYKKQSVVKRNLPEENAIEELIGLIKDNGDWQEG